MIAVNYQTGRLMLVVTISFLLVMASCLHCIASDADHAGIVKSLAGTVAILRNTAPLKAEPNMKLYKGDRIETGTDGKVGLIFEDDTVVSIGPNSTIVIDDFIFQPQDRKLSFIARILKGTVSYLSGQIGKLAPNKVRVETPQATVALRGTHILIKVD